MEFDGEVVRMGGIEQVRSTVEQRDLRVNVIVFLTSATNCSKYGHKHNRLTKRPGEKKRYMRLFYETIQSVIVKWGPKHLLMQPDRRFWVVTDRANHFTQ